FAGAYREAGLRRGDEILIFLRHTPALHGAFFGAMLGGFVPSFMPCSSPRQDPAIYWSSHQTLLERTMPAGIVADRATFAEIDGAGLRLGSARRFFLEELPRADADFDPLAVRETALLQHSSGTTGLKKGVALSYEAILAQIASYRRALSIGTDDVVVSWLPLYHDMGLIACAVMPAFLGVPIVQIDPFFWIARPRSLFDAIARYRGTLAWLPNFAFEHLTRVAARDAPRFDLSGMKAFIDCSEPCKAATLDRFRSAFAAAGVRAEHLRCCYAMAEAVFAVTQTAPGEMPRRIRVDPASIARGNRPVPVPTGGVELVEAGTAIDGVTLTIHDEARNPVPDATVGEIVIRAPFLFTHYN
ncbi:MAG: AMP-binding protein, partial [Stellaceae bacterium]